MATTELAELQRAAIQARERYTQAVDTREAAYTAFLDADRAQAEAIRDVIRADDAVTTRKVAFAQEQDDAEHDAVWELQHGATW